MSTSAHIRTNRPASQLRVASSMRLLLLACAMSAVASAAEITPAPAPPSPSPSPSPTPSPAPSPKPADTEKKPDPAALARQRAIVELNAHIAAAYAEATAATKAGDTAKADAAVARFRELDARQNRLIYEDFKLGYAAKLQEGMAPDPTSPKLTDLIELEKESAALKDEQAKSATDGSPAEKKTQLAEEIAELEEQRSELEPEAIYEAVYSTTILGVTRRFPELKDPQSEFSKRMDARIAELEARRDPLLNNPKHPLLIADEIQQAMEKGKGSAK